jgi:predicted outer membrane protein
MALGELEQKYLEDMAAIHEKAVKLSETYLGKSDNSSRPDGVVQMAARHIQQHNYNAQEIRGTIERMNGKGTSA